MPITLMCGGCSRKIRVPDTAAGKRVKCPQCGEIQAVGRPTSAAQAEVRPNSKPASPTSVVPGPRKPAARPVAAKPAAANPVAARPVAAGFASTPFAGGFAGFEDDLLTGSDLAGPLRGLEHGAGSPAVEIPKAPKKKKRSKAFYWAPGVCAIGAAGLNILTLLGALIFIVWAMIALMQAEVAGAGLLLYPIIRLCIFGFFVAGGNIHAIVAGLNLVTMRGRTASAVAIGELVSTPIAFALFFWFLLGWVAGLIFGIGMALYNWPVAGWVALAIAGKQAKIDFDEYDGDELDNLAEELQNRVSKKNTH